MSDSTETEAQAFEAKLKEIANLLRADHDIGVESVEADVSIGDATGRLNLKESPDEEHFAIKVQGGLDQKMWLRPVFGKKLSRQRNTYSDDVPRIGVSVMSRSAKAVAKDINSRLIPDAFQLHTTLKRRARSKARRENRREKMAEEINESTALEVSESHSRSRAYYSGRVWFEGEGHGPPSDQKVSNPPETDLMLLMRAGGHTRTERFKLELSHLTKEKAIQVVNAIEEIMDGPVRMKRRHDRE